MHMSRLDDVLTRELERVARPAPGPDAPMHEVLRRRARHRGRRKVGLAVLSVAVLVGSAASFIGLQRAFSPSGRHLPASESGAVANGEIAYSAPNPTTGDIDIFVMNADGTGTRVLHQPGDDYEPRWSPDGTRILYWKDGSGIYTMASDGTDVRKISHETAIFSLAWSPDGSTIAYTDMTPAPSSQSPTGDGTIIVNPVATIWLMNPDGTDVRSITMPGASMIETGPSWSPDGGQIAYSLRTGVWIANADGTDAHQIAADGWGPAWSPDGSTIVFTTRTGVQEIAPDGSGARTVATGSGVDYRSPSRRTAAGSCSRWSPTFTGACRTTTSTPCVPTGATSSN
jgi:Tol biopolymer transport system component